MRCHWPLLLPLLIRLVDIALSDDILDVSIHSRPVNNFSRSTDEILDSNVIWKELLQDVFKFFEKLSINFLCRQDRFVLSFGHVHLSKLLFSKAQKFLFIGHPYLTTFLNLSISVQFSVAFFVIYTIYFLIAKSSFSFIFSNSCSKIRISASVEQESDAPLSR